MSPYLALAFGENYSERWQVDGGFGLKKVELPVP